MNQRTVVITLILVCLMAVVGLVELRGWEESEDEPDITPEKVLEPEPPPACFDIILHPVYHSRPGGNAFLLNKCTGDSWHWIPDTDEITRGVWFPVRRY